MVPGKPTNGISYSSEKVLAPLNVPSPPITTTASMPFLIN